jgi:hypothetical protein
MYIEQLEMDELLDILDIIYDRDKIAVSKFTKIEDGILVYLSTKWEINGEEILDYDELLLEDFGFTSTYDVVRGAKRKFHQYMYDKFGKRYAKSYFGRSLYEL